MSGSKSPGRPNVSAALSTKFPSLVLADECETVEAASILARHIYGGLSIILNGTLGAGKTTLVRAIGMALGVNDIKSPTFTIESRHATQDGRKLIHADLYRLGALRPDSETAMQFEEYLADNAVLFVEWGERWLSPPSEDRWDITLAFVHGGEHGDCARTVDLEARGMSAHERLSHAYEEILELVMSGGAGRCR